VDEYKRKRRRIARHERKRELLRNPHPRCSVCGIDRVEMLQLHHTAGDANSELTQWVCYNHHAAISDMWQDSSMLLLHEPHSTRTRLASLLQGLVYFLETLNVTLKEWIAYLLDRGDEPL
jgi:hypothetical protein